MSAVQSRAAFELWLRKSVLERNGFNPDLTRMAAGQYVNIYYQWRWEAWCAATERAGEAP